MNSEFMYMNSEFMYMNSYTSYKKHSAAAQYNQP